MSRNIKTTLSLKCEDADGTLIDVPELVQYFDTTEAQAAYLQAITNALLEFGNADMVTDWRARFAEAQGQRSR